MSENSKVYVFEKKEVFLICVFVVVASLTTFTLGVRLGKNLSLTKAGISAEDIKTVELKSAPEESADEAIKEAPAMSHDEKLSKLMEESKEKLGDELNQFKDKDETENSSKEVTATRPLEKVTTADQYTGKFTIQLGSYGTMEEAKQFADGFTVRGYNPIINEVTITGKGTWYRVSLGVFDSMDAAKVYIKKEQSLFEGQSHIITEIR